MATLTTYNGISGIDGDGDTVHMAIDPPATHGSRDYMKAMTFMRRTIGAHHVKFHTDHERQAPAYHEDWLIERNMHFHNYEKDGLRFCYSPDCD